MVRALVAQRMEQKTSKFLTPPLQRTVYRVMGERGVVMRLACDEVRGVLTTQAQKEFECFHDLALQLSQVAWDALLRIVALNKPPEDEKCQDCCGGGYYQ